MFHVEHVQTSFRKQHGRRIPYVYLPILKSTSGNNYEVIRLNTFSDAMLPKAFHSRLIESQI